MTTQREIDEEILKYVERVTPGGHPDRDRKSVV